MMSRRGPKPRSGSGIVFDSEALVAFFVAEEGAGTTRRILKQVADGDVVGYLNDVNAAEVLYILSRYTTREKAEESIAWLRSEAGVRPVSSDDTWLHAAEIKTHNRLSLADAFALATGRAKDSVVLTGDDPEFDIGDRIGVKVMRMRD